MQTDSRYSSRRRFGLQPASAWLAILGCIFVIAACLLLRLGGILNVLFPLVALLVGAFLYWCYPVLYIGFSWWIFFLTPWIRRLADYQSGWRDPSPILLAPFLVGFLTVFTFLKHLPKANREGNLAFVLSVAAVLYSLFVGLINNPFTSVVPALLSWLTPILFGFHLLANWRSYPQHRQILQRTFQWGVVLMGAYGIIQFLSPPLWDQYWMNNAPIDSIGVPEPFRVRVFSTLNAPGPFANTLLAGLLLVFTHEGVLRIPAIGLGYLSFLLSLVRSAWFGWIIAIFSFVFSLKSHLQIKLFMALLTMLIGVVVLSTLEPFSEVIQERVLTFLSPQNDVSYNDRLEGYSEAIILAISQLTGQGLGYVIDNFSIGARDSAILDMLFTLGWLGTIPYLGGVVLIFTGLFRISEIRLDAFASASRAIGFGLLAQFGFGSVMIGIMGMVLWGFTSMALAADRYHRYHRCLEAANER